MRALAITLLLAVLGGCAAPRAADPGTFSFGLIGDLPYEAREERVLDELLRQMDGEPLAFVAHDGDIKSGGSRCDDALYAHIRQVFDGSRHPLIYVPGDNEWTDCHRASNGGYDPRERLARLREAFFAGDAALGQRRLKLERQSADARYAEYRENVRWVHGGVLFVGLNVPGSNNNFGRSASADAEYRERNAANLQWLREAFALAARESLLGMFIVIQANPLFELPPGDRQRSGYEDLLALLESGTVALGKPVVLVHGDTHRYRVDQPLVDRRSGRTIENFTRIETFGSPALGWVRVTIHPAGPKLFSIDPFRYWYK